MSESLQPVRSRRSAWAYKSVQCPFGTKGKPQTGPTNTKKQESSGETNQIRDTRKEKSWQLFENINFSTKQELQQTPNNTFL